MRNNKDIDNDGSNERTISNGALPGFLGNEGKCKEISSIFATIFRRGYDSRNESKGTIQTWGLFNSIGPTKNSVQIWKKRRFYLKSISKKINLWK